MSRPSFVPIPPARRDLQRKLGPASYLHDLLVDHQTDPEGRVNYGKAFGYAWLRSRWRTDGNSFDRDMKAVPTIRTLKRYMRRLKLAGLVWVDALPYGQGMRVCLLGSVKWKPDVPAPTQIPLFPPPETVSINSGKLVRKLSKTMMERDVQWGTKVSPIRGQKCPPNEVKNQPEETIYGDTARSARSAPVENAAALEARRKLLRDQAEMLATKFKTKTSC